VYAVCLAAPTVTRLTTGHQVVEFVATAAPWFY
jgi:hypothetical protein